MTEQIDRTTQGIILYDDALLSHAGVELFQPEYWRSRGALQDAVGGRGGAFIVAAPGGDWVLRHYHRGGFAAHLSRDRYLWTGLERSRPWREWRLLAELYREGLPVPQPVAAQVQPGSLLYRGDLITRRIPDARSLAEGLSRKGHDRLPWADVGRCIQRFHAAGIWHADLNAHNILIDKQGRVYLIDFDRGTRRPPQTSWQAANLRRLYRSLSKLLPDGPHSPDVFWKDLMEGYGV
jgi:3-deoxy-D-manno-octulosonic acid kinase